MITRNVELTLSDLIATAAVELAALHSLAEQSVRSSDRKILRRAVRIGLDDLCQLLHRDEGARLEFENAQAHTCLSILPGRGCE